MGAVVPMRGRRRPVAEALTRVAAGAVARDRAGAGFPEDAVAALEEAGLFAATLPEAGEATAVAEWTVVRAVARADGSVARILDGHLNAVERVAHLAPAPLRGAVLDGVAAASVRLGVWGADPAPGEGEPARLAGTGSARRLEGTKVFCSGAGGIDLALVTARDGDRAPALVLADARGGTRLDRGWFAGSGMRTSESHRVTFRDAPVIAVLGEPGELTRQPWLARDAIRTAACWAGIADRAADAALDALAQAPPSDLAALAAGRMLGALATLDRCFSDAAARMADGPPAGPEADALSVHVRVAVAEACRTISQTAAGAVGSRALAQGGELDLCRRDLDLFLLQHRLEPMVVRLGADELERRR